MWPLPYLPYGAGLQNFQAMYLNEQKYKHAPMIVEVCFSQGSHLWSHCEEISAWKSKLIS